MRGEAAGAIYDIGYRRYDGPRLGRGYAFRTLFVHSLRAAWGVGRGARARVAPLALFTLILLPAVIQLFLDGTTGGGARLLHYGGYFGYVQFLVTLFCAGQAPELVSTDQQHRVLPLYFSRALRRGDYALAKLLAMIAALLILMLVPMLILFLGRVSVGADLAAALRAERGAILPILGSSLAIATLLGSVSVAVASYAPRRALASAAVFGTVVLSTAVAQILSKAATGGVGEYAAVLNPFRVLGSITRSLFGPDTGPTFGPPPRPETLSAATFAAAACVIVVVSVAALLARYSRVRA
jgi:ABC-2 type transport system permease protein